MLLESLRRISASAAIMEDQSVKKVVAAMSSESVSVLVVEDDLGVSRVLRIVLREAGFAVRYAATGGEALLALDAEPTDAVVLDLGLPDGQSGAVLAWLNRRKEQGHGLPVWVVISALDPEEAVRRYGRLGAPFVAKPFDPWELVNSLRGLLT